MRLIDADRLTASQSLSGVLYYPMTEIENAPTIDVERPTKAQFKRMAVQLGYEQVVHCKGCKNWHSTNCALDYAIFEPMPDSFCSYGERKDQ